MAERGFKLVKFWRKFRWLMLWLECGYLNGVQLQAYNRKDTEQLGAISRSEFRRDNVLKFLKDLYTSDNLNMQNLELDKNGPVAGASVDTHDVAVVNVAEEIADKRNFSEQENRNWGLSFSPVDISLCFGIYVLSAVILIVVN